MEKIVIQINGGMMVNVEMSVKKMSVCDHVCKKIIFGILLYVIVKIENI